MITFEGVTKRYPDGTVAVDHLDLEIPSGKTTIFVGPSGCGKTTSLRMINRMIDPTDGRITIDGDDIRSMDVSKLRRGIGYVIQHAGLFPHRTVLDNVATVPFLLGEDKKAARRRAAELLERVGLPAAMGSRYPGQLSGGQQQRVGVARALAADPPVLLMDEPFSAVDPIVRDNLQEEFLKLQAELGKTIVFVTHDIDEAVKLGDLVGVFAQGGRLVQLAGPQELLTSPSDAFVADFVGRDRGIRSLSFVGLDGLRPAEERTARLDGSRVAADTLVVDADGRPLGWAGDGGATSDHELRPLGGTLAPGASLRRALDLALVSPTGRAVVVDGAGAVAGTLSYQAVAEHLATVVSGRSLARPAYAVGDDTVGDPVRDQAATA